MFEVFLLFPNSDSLNLNSLLDQVMWVQAINIQNISKKNTENSIIIHVLLFKNLFWLVNSVYIKF